MKSSGPRGKIFKNHGLEGDAHAGLWHRQVSFLASERILNARYYGLDVYFGLFARVIPGGKICGGDKVKLFLPNPINN